MKKLISLFAAIMMASTGLVQAQTIENVKYIDENGMEQICPSAIAVNGSSGQVTWGTFGETTWYVVNGTRVISGGVICLGAVHLILVDDWSLRVVEVGNEIAGIQVSGERNSLTIYGQTKQTGKLDVIGGNYGAGIGGERGCSGSNITINGGMVTATGGDCGAGIGGGYSGVGVNITINGGTVTATGGDKADGIGSGHKGDTSHDIFVADGVKVMADESVIGHTSISGDIASELAGKKNVTAIDLSPILKAINNAVGSLTDATIIKIANAAKESIFEQATVDGAKSVCDLAIAKINAIKEILPLMSDDTNVRNTEFISDIIESIVLATEINDINTKKAQAEIAISAFLTGRSSALGTMGTKQDGPALIVTDKDGRSFILYSPKSVEYIKVNEK